MADASGQERPVGKMFADLGWQPPGTLDECDKSPATPTVQKIFVKLLRESKTMGKEVAWCVMGNMEHCISWGEGGDEKQWLKRCMTPKGVRRVIAHTHPTTKELSAADRGNLAKLARLQKYHWVVMMDGVAKRFECKG